MMTRTSHIFTISVVLLLVGFGVARGEEQASSVAEPGTFRQLIERAIRYYEGGRYDDAIREFAQAYAQNPKPAILFNIAQSHRKAGRRVEALTVYESFLRKESDPVHRAEAEHHAVELRSALQREEEARRAEQEALRRAKVSVPIEPAEKKGPPRGVRYIEVSAGVILSGHRLSFTEEDPSSPVHCYDFDFAGAVVSGMSPPQNYSYLRSPSCPSYAATVQAGVHVDANVFPLLGLRPAALRGLGLGATLDYFPGVGLCKDEGGMCAAGDELLTSELRIEAGLRFVYSPSPRRDRPSLLASLQYGLHRFVVQKERKRYVANSDGYEGVSSVEWLDDHGIPDVQYQYVDFGLGARLPFFANERFYIGAQVELHYHLMADYGELSTQFSDLSRFTGGYGPVQRGHGVRIAVSPLELQPLRGFLIGASAFYERFDLAFALGDPLPPGVRDATSAARHLAASATDQYYGGVLQVGYRY